MRCRRADFRADGPIAEVILTNSHQLLSRGETNRLIDWLNHSNPKLVEELIPKLLTLGELQRVLQALLREQVSIRDLETILEGLIKAAATNKHPVALVEAARQTLSRATFGSLLSPDGELKVVRWTRPSKKSAFEALTYSQARLHRAHCRSP